MVETYHHFMAADGRSGREDLEAKRLTSAYHEAGHVVVAAVEGLKLGYGALGIDRAGNGFASYDTDAKGSDMVRKKIVTAALAGFYAERRCCALCCYPIPQENWLHEADGCQATDVLKEMAVEDHSNGNTIPVEEKLKSRAENLVRQHWQAIEILAGTLLVKQWKEMPPHVVGDQRCEESLAQCVKGREAVLILKQFGISANCLPD